MEDNKPEFTELERKIQSLTAALIIIAISIAIGFTVVTLLHTVYNGTV